MFAIPIMVAKSEPGAYLSLAVQMIWRTYLGIGDPAASHA
jgi:hypothetical protein